jgi:hypothetical protein
VAAVQRVTPFNAHAAKSVNAFTEYAGPTKGFIEQVYCLHPFADGQNKTTIMLRNAAADRAVTMRFSLDHLPYLTLWKNTTALEEGYVTGLEPGTGFPFNRRIERQFGRVPKLAPGESRALAVDYAILSGKSEVERAAAEINRIQDGRKTQVDAEPVTAE